MVSYNPRLIHVDMSDGRARNASIKQCEAA